MSKVEIPISTESAVQEGAVTCLWDLEILMQRVSRS